MRTLDLTPLYRSVIGADQMARMLDKIDATENNNGYPPYNVEVVDENRYRITLALAGFKLTDLEIEQENNLLKVAGQKADDKVESKYLHQGIAKRNFGRRFQLADHIEVAGARFEDGLLHIDLVREIPEAMKPKKIAIQSTDVIENG